MGIVIDGRTVEIPGIVSRSYLEIPRWKLSLEDSRLRMGRVTSIVLHTTKGIPAKRGGPGWKNAPQRILPGLGRSAGAGDRAASCWTDDGRPGGAHLVVDFDGFVSCHADLQGIAAYHAGAANSGSIGLEIYQGRGAELYVGQLEAVVTVVDWLTRRFGIQRAVPSGYIGPVARLETGAKDYVGVFGHRDCSANRGPGDPGDEVFNQLRAAGYEAWNIDAQQDILAWKSRQVRLRVVADGVPGPKTVAALIKAGYPGGMWIKRPGDAPAVA